LVIESAKQSAIRKAGLLCKEKSNEPEREKKRAQAREIRQDKGNGQAT
jgi:hypothetical protein